MKHKIILFGLMCFLWSCQNKQVQLVKSDYAETSEVTDHSPVYFLLSFKEKDTILEVNRKNTIGTTNWIFHIDKRSPLKLAIAQIHELQNRKKNGMHSNPEAQNYYSYTDSIQKTLAFKNFTDITYSYNQYHANEYVKDNFDYHLNFQTVIIDFYQKNRVRVDGHVLNFDEVAAYLKEYLDFTISKKQVLLYLNINEDLLFDDYLQLFLQLAQFQDKQTQLSSTHFVYDKTKVNCDCD